MWSTIDIVLSSKTPIYTYCTGYAMSSGLNIFLSGHKRYASKHATFLYHQLVGGFHGKYQDMIENFEESNRVQKQVEEYILERTKITQARLDKVREKKSDWYIGIDEAIDLGIVDEII